MVSKAAAPVVSHHGGAFRVLPSMVGGKSFKSVKSFETVRSVLLAALALSATACSDKRCSAANCDVMLNACKLEPAGSPNIGACVKAGLMLPATYKDQRAGTSSSHSS